MKKLLLSLLLLSLSSIAFCKSKPVITTGRMYHAKDTTRTFGILEMDHDLFIKKLTGFLGNPATNTTGNITWEKVNIKGLDGPVKLTIRDGIMTYNKQNSTACRASFDSKADKRQKLVNLTKEQARDMEIEITDSKGIKYYQQQ
jgi:hypothetical protein